MASTDMVELGAVGGTAYGYAVGPGSRHRREAPAFVDRFSTGEQSHRGDAFWQHWVMSGFRGGIGQKVFDDVEMVDSMVGMNGAEAGKLFPFDGWAEEIAYAYVYPAVPSSPPASAYKYRPRRFAVSADQCSIEQDQVRTLYCADIIGDEHLGCSRAQAAVSPCATKVFDGSAGLLTGAACPTCGSGTLVEMAAMVHYSTDGGLNWTSYAPQKTGGVYEATAYQGITSMCYFEHTDVSGNKIPAMYFGTRRGDLYYAAANGSLAGKLTNVPFDIGRALTAMVSYAGKLYVAQNQKIWSWDGKNDARANWSTEPVAETDVHITCCTVWNGAMWFGGYQSFHGKLYRIDGAGAIEVASLTDNFSIQSLCPYDGALYIGGAQYDKDKLRHVGKVYRYNGASLSELDLGKAGLSRQYEFMHGIWDMEVWNGFLILPCADYQGVMAYNGSEDAFYRLPRCVTTDITEDDYEMVYGSAVFQGNLFLSIPKHGVFRYTPATLSVSQDASGNAANGQVYNFETSFFDAGVELVDKLFWSVTGRLEDWGANDKVLVSYRTTPGASWTSLGTLTNTTSELNFHDASGNHIGTLARGLQLRFQFTFAGNTYGTFRGFYVRYIVEPDVRYNWSMNLLCIDNVETPTRARHGQTGAQMGAALWALRESRQPVRFRDVDGTWYTVVVRSVSEFQNSVNTADGVESVFSVQLWEV